MKKGLVLGKFDCFHKGHQALIEFAKKQCDLLYVLVCSNEKEEKIPGPLKLKWVLETYRNDDKVQVRYTDKKLPYTSESSRPISHLWALHIKELFPDSTKRNTDVDIFISSEPYGEYVAEFLGIQHISFDQQRRVVPINATMIRNNPVKYWDFISDVAKPYFVKKICICGTESTGKTILTEKLSKTFETNYVPEWGRQIVKKSDDVTLDDIMNIGTTHARDILEKVKASNKILFSDTNLDTTKMYSKYFFNKIPEYEDWVEKANIFDLYVFLENDAPYIQDGTRLPKEDRDKLRDYHYNYLKSKGLKMEIVTGSEWDKRTDKAIDIIEKNFFNS